MDILIELVAEIFTWLFGSQANKVGLDREVPKFVKIPISPIRVLY